MRYLIMIIVALNLIIFYSCSDNSSEPTAKQINLKLDTVMANVLLEVVYRAGNSGDAQIDEIIYYSNDGAQTLSKPAIPWSKTVDIDKGNKVFLSAKGSVTSGSAYIKMEGKGNEGGSTQSFNDSTGTSQY